MNRSIALLLPAALLAAAGCSEQNFRENIDQVDPLDQQLAACIDINPRRIEFEAVSIADEDFVPEERVVTVSNTCEGTLEIDRVQLGGNAPDGVFKVANLDEVLLGAGETAQFTVTFEPQTSGDFSGRVTVRSNDAETPEETVRLEGQGIAPQIEVTPDNYDYGSPYIGCENGQVFSITNQGNADLVVDGAEVFTASVEEFSVDLDPLTNGALPFTVAPYDSAQGGPIVDVYLDYLPLDTFKDDAFVTFYSNDPFLSEKVTTAEGTGTKFGDNLDIFEQPIRSATDIMFTLDRSCSMSDNIENVAANFDVFVGTLASLDADYHATVIVADDGCAVGPDPYIDGTFSESAAVGAFRVMADPDFSLAGYGSNTERGYMQAEAALSSRNISAGGCNDEFYREDAFLSIVHVSDEPEQSVNSWSYYVSLFQSLKADPEDVRINAVAGDYPSGCGSASAGTGYYEGTVATGGLFLSICATDWAKNLEDLATESVAINDSFELTQQPVPQTIEVKIDGVRVNVGWEYDISSNSVVFDNDFIPAGGSTIEVFYERLPDCEG